MFVHGDKPDDFFAAPMLNFSKYSQSDFGTATADFAPPEMIISIEQAIEQATYNIFWFHLKQFLLVSLFIFTFLEYVQYRHIYMYI